VCVFFGGVGGGLGCGVGEGGGFGWGGGELEKRVFIIFGHLQYLSTFTNLHTNET